MIPACTHAMDIELDDHTVDLATAVNAMTVVVLTDAGNTVIQDYWVRQVEAE